MNSRLLKENIFKVAFTAAALFSVAAVIAITAFLLCDGARAVNKIGLNFFFSPVWNADSSDVFASALNGTYGIAYMFISSLTATFFAVLIGGSLGFLSAAALAFFVNKKVEKWGYMFINTLSGIPSVVFGFFGMKVILPFFGIFSPSGDGSGLLSTAVILGVMITPTVSSVCYGAFKSVENQIYEGALALGLTREQAIFGAVIPAAKSGTNAAIILGVGRAIGETMAVIMLAGNSVNAPTGLFVSFRTLTANIALEMGYAGEVQRSALIATGGALLAITAIISLSAAATKTNNTKCARISRLSALSANKKFAKFKKNASVAICFFACLIPAAIVVFVFIGGIGHINAQFLFSDYEYGKTISILPSFVSTLLLLLVSSAISFPIGLAAAVYLSEYAKKNKITAIVRGAIDVLSGVPSIVYGLFGMLIFCNFFSLGTSIISGALTISLLVLPIIIKTAEENLKGVPESCREASFALGMTKSRTVAKVLLPACRKKMISSALLALGRILGESAPLVFTMGASLKPMPQSLLSGGTTLSVALYKLAGEGLYTGEAYATACVLIILVFALNLISVIGGETKVMHKKTRAANA